MFKEFKADLYKVVKSKRMLIAFILAVLLMLIYPLSNFEGCPSIRYLFSCDTTIPLIVMIGVSIVFSTLDFSSGAIKNFYERTGKIRYVLSKFIMIFLFAIVLSGILFLEHLIIVKIFGTAQIAGDPKIDIFTTTQYVYGGICRVFMLTFFGTLACMVAIVTRPAVFPVAITFLYQFTGNFLWYEIESMLKLKYGTFTEYLVACNYGMIPNPDVHPEKTLIYLAIMGGAMVLFFVISCIAFRKRRV